MNLHVATFLLKVGVVQHSVLWCPFVRLGHLAAASEGHAVLGPSCWGLVALCCDQLTFNPVMGVNKKNKKKVLHHLSPMFIASVLGEGFSSEDLVITNSKGLT